MSLPDRGYFSLVIRIWWEGGSQGILRGTIDIVQTGERLAFQTLPDLIAHLTEIVGEGKRAQTGSHQDTDET